MQKTHKFQRISIAIANKKKDKNLETRNFMKILQKISTIQSQKSLFLNLVCAVV